MSRCPNCQIIIIEKASYCHGCGKALRVNCLTCATSNSILNLNCRNCGDHIPVFPDQKGPESLRFTLDFRETSTLNHQIINHFFEALRTAVAEEHDIRKIEEYLDTFASSPFKSVVEKKSLELAEEAYTIHCKQNEEVVILVDKLLKENLDPLVDQFIIKYCQEINQVNFSSDILNHAYSNKENVKIPDLIKDYLDPEKEEEIIYVDIKKVPESKLKNARQSFLFPEVDEQLLLLCDQTVFGSCKEGFAITNEAIYWKAHFHPAQSIAFKDIIWVKKDTDWITINNLFFNVNPSLNIKMLKLLKKLQKIYSQPAAFSVN